jgi:hypothetical protein
VCDFFCQPQVPAPMHFMPHLLDELAGGLPSPTLQDRVRVLFPVYQLKWVCIMLNEFLPVGSQRRRFAQPGTDTPSRKEQQLHKASARLAKVMSFEL